MSKVKRLKKSTARIVKIEPAVKVAEYRKGQQLKVGGKPYEVSYIDYQKGELHCKEIAGSTSTY